MVRETEHGIQPFLSGSVPLTKVLIYLLLSVGAIWIAHKSGLFWIEYKFRKPKAALFFGLIFLVSLCVPHFQSNNPIHAALIENTAFDVVKNSLYSTPIRVSSHEPIFNLLSPTPLPSESGGDPEWHYFDNDYPLAKATTHHLCQLGLMPSSRCEKDMDQDGHPVKTDCNDRNPSVYPGATDISRNGIDEDCSGVDKDPPNVIFIHWEGARAVNFGKIGYSVPSTPRLDELSDSGVIFSSVRANGARTRWSLISIYCSILPRLSPYWIFKYKPKLNLLSFPKILRDHGYHTIYLHGGWIDFSQKRERMEKWFETLYDQKNSFISKIDKVNSWGLDDKDLFEIAYRLISEREDKRPFYMTIATVSNHYPFTMPDNKFEHQNHTNKKNQVPNLMRYSDHFMGEFIEKILNNKSLENTIILVAGDHGHNWYAPHRTSSQTTPWEDMVWVPLVLLGKNWNVAPQIISENRQLADIGPTILDRLGIIVPNHFIGHSLLRRTNLPLKTFFGSAEGDLIAGVRWEEFKYFTYFRTGKEHLYQMKNDPEEKNNLVDDPQYSDYLEKGYGFVSNTYKQNSMLIKNNQIWNPEFYIGKKL